MKVRNGFVSNSSTTSFILKYKEYNIEDFERKFKLFLQAAILCGYLDSLWESKLNEIEIYEEDGKTIIECDQMPEEIKKIIRALLPIQEERFW